MRINHKTKPIKKDFKENTFVAFISVVCKGERCQWHLLSLLRFMAVN